MDVAATASVPQPWIGRRVARSTHRRLLADADHLLPLAALTVLSTAGTVFAPLLWTIPLVLVACSPRLPFLVLAAAQSAFVPFLLVGSLRLLVADPFHFGLGRRHGPTVGSAVGRRLPARVRHWFAAAGPERPGHRWACCAALFLRPSSRILAWAGAIRIPGPLVAGLDIGGTLAYVALVYGGQGLFS